MTKCEFCGQEVDLPFRCTFCDGKFCIQHRLPKNHSCPQAPQRTPLGQWKAKTRKPEPKELSPLPRTPRAEECRHIKKTLRCPRCASERAQTTAYRPDYIYYECLDCGCKWEEKRRETKLRIGRREIKNLLSSYLAGVIFAIVGSGIVFWQVYSPLLTFLLVFYVIPIPLILIGIILFAIGFLVIVRTIVSMIRTPSISIKLVAIPSLLGLLIFSSFGITMVSTLHRTFYMGTIFVNVDYLRNEVFSLINEERLSCNLPELSFDQKLLEVAQAWSEDLARRSILEHGDFAARMSAIGYGSYECGEIIAEIDLLGMGFFETRVERDFVDGWLESSGHREIMLMPFTGYLGVGCSKNSDRIYCVADFRFDEWE